jgi:hypothetical protein
MGCTARQVLAHELQGCADLILQLQCRKEERQSRKCETATAYASSLRRRGMTQQDVTQQSINLMLG